MAQILSFRTPEYRSGSVSSRDDDRSAEVIVFPGVRYERWSEAHASAVTRDAGQRDVIELADQ